MQIANVVSLYDVELIRVDADAGRIYFDYEGIVMGLKRTASSAWSAGAIGRLTLRPDHSFGFYVYPDPGLRRFASLDDPSRDEWGWRLGELRFRVKAHVIPGLNGQIVRAQLTKIEIDVPQEFRELCAGYALTPIQALRGFIADVCGLQSFLVRPREDGYSSHGSDERLRAQQYWDRAYLAK